MIPKTTTPLAKSIRTLEGQLVTGSNVVAVALSAVDPSVLPHKYAAAIVVIQNVVLTLQRGLIKVQSSKAVNAVLDAPTVAAAIEVVEDYAPDYAGAPDPAQS